jgi:hypothetical protein
MGVDITVPRERNIKVTVKKSDKKTRTVISGAQRGAIEEATVI